MGKKHITGFLFLIMLFAYVGHALAAPVVVLCVSGTAHVTVEFAHNNTVTVPRCEIKGSGSQSSSTSRSKELSHKQCTDSPLFDRALTSNVTSTRSDCPGIIPSAYGPSHWLSNDYLGGLYFIPLPCPPSSQTSTSSCIRATVLLI
jgi:hypothetical protein